MARNLKKDETKPEVIVRVVKFEIKPTPMQLKTLQRVSDNTWFIWNTALQERMAYFQNSIQPLFEALKTASAAEKGAIKEQLKSAYAAAPVNYDPRSKARSQRNWLTQMRQSRADFAAIPCAWQQETLVILEGAYDSFYKLRKNGDTTARPPREKHPDAFCEIQGLLSWQLQIGNATSSLAGGTILNDIIKINPQKPVTEKDRSLLATTSFIEIVLSPGKTLLGGTELRFAIPAYQRLVLSAAVKLNKFTLYRESRRGKLPRFWISIAYSIPKPVTTTSTENEKVFLVLGASSIGVSAPTESYTIDLWRSDTHWIPKIETLRERLKKCTKGSRAYGRRVTAIDRMYEIMRKQTLQHHREVIVTELKKHGVHFVIMAQSPIRGKKGALADGNNPARGGTLGANWSVQNTGSLAQLRQLLEQKVVEWGGSVELITLEQFPHDASRDTRRQVAAEALRSQLCAA